MRYPRASLRATVVAAVSYKINESTHIFLRLPTPKGVHPISRTDLHPRSRFSPPEHAQTPQKVVIGGVKEPEKTSPDHA